MTVQQPPADPNVQTGAAPAEPVVPSPAPGQPPAPPSQASRPIVPRPAVPAAALSGDTLKARLEQQKRATLRELGIDDPERWKAEQAAKDKRLAEFQQREEEAKRASMTELDRLRADLDAEKAARLAAESKAQEAEEARVAQERDVVVREVASRHIDPEFYELAALELRRYCQELARTAPKKLERMTDADIDAFFADLAKRRPRLAPAPAEGTDPKNGTSRAVAARRPAILPPRTRPAGGAPIRQPPAAQAKQGPAGIPAGKTLRPGLPNSMTKAEVDAYLRASGRRPYG